MTSLDLTAQAIQAAGWHVVRTPRGSWWVEGGNWRKVAKAVELHQMQGDVTVSVVPLLELGNFRVRGDSPCLWVRTETRDAVKRLARFTPEPTLIVAEGKSVRSVALWSLLAAVPSEKLERANGRLSYHLGCKKLHGRESFEFAPPGTVLREGRRRGVPVVAAGGSGEPVSWGTVVGKLRDRPDPPDWIGSRAA